ncbi:hypothetical protein [Thiocystis violascens]|uniref:Uncharacterized protein n=1 Tax=Thiocystis violascens (strain ATCC 17096 / DSM 198 / 6111) TaxID=765911 RepID=I3Y8P0_THIV6|nr:hypothetical protein [Thiocystis violascens]AFL73358.1 hypothetical protein Thivi_1345 [Thiocystis violascens DSM 198]
MSILTAELQWFRPALQSDTVPAQNGGRCTEALIVSGVKNNLFPDVSAAQRAAGVEHWRKVFVAVKNADNLTLVDPKLSIEIGTPGDSHVLLYSGTLVDTQDQVTARPYGYGTLASAADAADTEISVTTEADFSAMTAKPFQVGDLVRIDARATLLDTGLSEYVEIDSISYTGTALTIGLTAGLANAYSAGAKIASVIEPGDLATAVSGKSMTGGVTYDDTAYPIAVPQIGGIYQTWTVTVTDHATGALSVSGDLIGAVGTGSTGVNLSPSNPNGGTYFTLDADGWGGTPATGDTLVFTTSPAVCPLWYRRIVPAGAAAISSDPVSVCVEGESA